MVGDLGLLHIAMAFMCKDVNGVIELSHGKCTALSLKCERAIVETGDMGIYTKNGDDGYTSRIDGERISKTSTRIEAVGTVDELNSQLGLCLCGARTEGLDELAEALLTIQNELFVIGARLAAAGTSLSDCTGGQVDEHCIKRMEQRIDQAMAVAGKLEGFILPGGSELSARFHVARTVCRRAERTAVALANDNVPVQPVVLKYLNRLGDLMFAFARLANHEAGFDDIVWKKK